MRIVALGIGSTECEISHSGRQIRKVSQQCAGLSQKLTISSESLAVATKGGYLGVIGIPAGCEKKGLLEAKAS